MQTTRLAYTEDAAPLPCGPRPRLCRPLACSRSRPSAEPAPCEAGYACTSSTAALCHPASAPGPRLEVPVQAPQSRSRTASRGRAEARAPANRRHSSNAAAAAAARWSDLPMDDPLPYRAAHALLNGMWSRPLHANRMMQMPQLSSTTGPAHPAGRLATESSSTLMWRS